LSSNLSAFSVWSTTRAAGITSYLFLFLSTAAGIVMSLRALSGRAKTALLVVHQSCGWFGFLFGGLHGAVLLFDQYVGYSPLDLLIPFTAYSHPVLNGLGTIGFYISFVLILSSDLMKRLGRNVWRTIHFMAFPGFIVSLLHGLLIGTDSHQSWAIFMYIATGAIIMLLTVLRFTGLRQEIRKPYSAV
jgi:methionine sulfoxide reductase heme-binding subunit